MNILGLQKNHNASVALFCDNKLVYYNQEERLSKIKNDDSNKKRTGLSRKKIKV